MGQKSNPISLRLEKTNQHWSSCWYGDYNYTTQFLQDSRVHAYFQNCSQQLKRIPPIPFLKHQRGQMQIALFSPRPARTLFPYGMVSRGGVGNRPAARTPVWYAREKEKKIKVDTLNACLSTTIPTLVETTLFNPNRYQSSTLFINAGERDNRRKSLKVPVWAGLRGLLFALELGIMHKGLSTQLIGLSTQLIGLSTQLTGLSTESKDQPLLDKRDKRAYPHITGPLSQEYRRRTGCSLTTRFESSIATAVSVITPALCGGVNLFYRREGYPVPVTYRCKVHLFKSPSTYQSPFFVASRVVFLLEERVPFRQLKLRLIPELIQEIEKSAYIKGVRITCSGRVASRSKKAQKARTDSIQWGETGLSIFSESVHFASKSAQTMYGKLGVKVWVCYSINRVDKC